MSSHNCEACLLRPGFNAGLLRIIETPSLPPPWRRNQQTHPDGCDRWMDGCVCKSSSTAPWPHPPIFDYFAYDSWKSNYPLLERALMMLMSWAAPRRSSPPRKPRVGAGNELIYRSLSEEKFMKEGACVPFSISFSLHWPGNSFSVSFTVSYRPPNDGLEK